MFSNQIPWCITLVGLVPELAGPSTDLEREKIPFWIRSPGWELLAGRQEELS